MFEENLISIIEKHLVPRKRDPFYPTHMYDLCSFLIDKTDYTAPIEDLKNFFNSKYKLTDEKIFSGNFSAIKSCCFIFDEGNEVRLSTKKDIEKGYLFLSNAMKTGEELARIHKDKSEEQKSIIAHNYFLAWPWAMEIICDFFYPGLTQKEFENKKKDKFFFNRKLNPFYIDNFTKEMESLGILEEKENRYFVKKVTGPPAQFLFTRFYLNITQGKLEKPVELGDIEMEYTLYFPSNTFAIPWYKECGQEKPFFEIIAAGTKARLLKDDFVRMVGLGLISPIDIAKVLKAYKENKLLEELWNKFDNSIKASSKTLPINYKELKKEFDFNG